MRTILSIGILLALLVCILPQPVKADTHPSVPQLVSPNNCEIVGAGATLLWNASIGASYYWLEVNTSLSWTSNTRIFYGNVGNILSKTISGLPEGYVYWRLMAGNKNGWSSPSSRYFRVDRKQFEYNKMLAQWALLPSAESWNLYCWSLIYDGNQWAIGIITPPSPPPDMCGSDCPWLPGGKPKYPASVKPWMPRMGEVIYTWDCNNGEWNTNKEYRDKNGQRVIKESGG